MIPASIAAGITALQAAAVADAPLATMTGIEKAALLQQGNQLVAAVGVALLAAAGNLDGPDPTGMPNVLIAGLCKLASASDDQATLAAVSGLVGRAVLNIAQGGN